MHPNKHRKPMPKPKKTADIRLTIHAAEALPAHCPDDDTIVLMPVDLADIRAWRYFKASPMSFFEQYADDFLIANANLAPDVLKQAVVFLDENPVSTLKISGHFSRQAIEAIKALAQEHDIGVDVCLRPAARAIRAEVDEKSGALQLAWTTGAATVAGHLAAAGHAPGKGTVQRWTQTFRELLVGDFLPELRLRDRDMFFRFMKALSALTARPVNWTELGRQTGASHTCVRAWTEHLAAIGLVDLIGPMTAPAPRRAKLRPKLYWTAPGLALWLSDTMTRPTAGQISALYENAVYLALKDAMPDAYWLHFMDTNAIEVHLIALESGKFPHPIFFTGDKFDDKFALKCLKSLAKIGLVGSEAWTVPASGLNAAELEAGVLQLP